MRRANTKLQGVIRYTTQDQMRWYLEDAKAQGYTLVYVDGGALMYR